MTVLNRINIQILLTKSEMSEEEIIRHPECETIGGYIKTIIVEADKQKNGGMKMLAMMIKNLLSHYHILMLIYFMNVLA